MCDLYLPTQISQQPIITIHLYCAGGTGAWIIADSFHSGIWAGFAAISFDIDSVAAGTSYADDLRSQTAICHGKT